MSDGWSKVAERLGRDDPGRTGSAAGETDAGRPERPVPAGWEALAARQTTGREPAGGTRTPEPVTAPSGWEAIARRRGARPVAAPVTEASETAPEHLGDEDPGQGATTVRRARRRGRGPERKAAADGPLPADAELDQEDGLEPDDEAALAEEEVGGDRPAGRRPRRRALLAGAAVAVLAAVGVVVGLLVTGGGLPARAAFSVNGKVTTVAQLKAQVNVLDQLQGITPPAQTNRSAYDTFLRTSAQALAVQQLVGDIAKREGISIPDKTTRADLDQLVATKYSNDRSQFDATLSSAGLNETEVLNALNAQAVENALYSRHTNNSIQVSDAQVAQTYSANQPFTQPEQRAISLIVVATQATAQDVLNQLNSGASFATLASQDSLDASKANGGADGTYSQADLQSSGQTTLAQAVFGATPNVPFGPVQAGGGEWVVGEVTSVTPAQTYGYDAQTQAAIKNYLIDQQLRQQWISYLGRQLHGADITYAAAYRPAKPDQPPQPALPSVLQFVINAHTGSSTSTSPGSASTPSTP